MCVCVCVVCVCVCVSSFVCVCLFICAHVCVWCTCIHACNTLHTYMYTKHTHIPPVSTDIHLHAGYSRNDQIVKWFWQLVEEYSNEDRLKTATG